MSSFRQCSSVILNSPLTEPTSTPTLKSFTVGSVQVKTTVLDCITQRLIINIYQDLIIKQADIGNSAAASENAAPQEL